MVLKIFTKTNLLLTVKTILVAVVVYYLSVAPQMAIVQIASGEGSAISFFALWVSSVVLTLLLLWKTGYLPLDSVGFVEVVKKYLTPKNFLKLIGLLVLLLCVSIVSTQVIRLLGLATESENQKALLFIGDKIPIVIFLTMVGGAGFFEELIFRKVIYDYLENINSVVAILLTSALFSFAHHPTDAGSFLSYLIYGLFFGILRFRTKAIVPNIILHTSWNVLLTSIIF